MRRSGSNRTLRSPARTVEARQTKRSSGRWSLGWAPYSSEYVSSRPGVKPPWVATWWVTRSLFGSSAQPNLRLRASERLSQGTGEPGLSGGSFGLRTVDDQPWDRRLTERGVPPLADLRGRQHGARYTHRETMTPFRSGRTRVCFENRTPAPGGKKPEGCQRTRSARVPVCHLAEAPLHRCLARLRYGDLARNVRFGGRGGLVDGRFSSRSDAPPESNSLDDMGEATEAPSTRGEATGSRRPHRDGAP
jgi:hypothetical protein